MLTVSAKVAAALRDLSPRNHEAQLGVAVSGGPDSVALLSALLDCPSRQRLKLVVLHVNHALRPESDQEQQIVESLSLQFQLPCFVERLSPPRQSRGIEVWARKERYRFFQQKREQLRLDAIAIAHTSDDQAETVLFRLLRGSGRRGLAGIPPQREGWLIRPLLGCSRSEVMDYLSAKHLPYVTDPSNADLRFSRNKIRHVLLPLLEREFSPQIRRHLVHLAESLRQEEEWLDSQARAAYERVQVGSAILVEKLQQEPAALHARLFHFWFAQAGHTEEVGFAHFRQLNALSKGRNGRMIELPGGWVVKREGSLLSLYSRPMTASCTCYRYALVPGESLVIPETGWQFSLSLPFAWTGSVTEVHQSDSWRALFDADKLAVPLTVRNGKPGDRLHPLGMRGHKKIHDIFIDKKVARSKRQCWPLVESNREITWIPGLVRGASATISPATQRVVQLTVNPLPENQKLC